MRHQTYTCQSWQKLAHPGVPSQAGVQVACQVLADVHDVTFSAMRLIFAEVCLVKLADGLLVLGL